MRCSVSQPAYLYSAAADEAASPSETAQSPPDSGTVTTVASDSTALSDTATSHQHLPPPPPPCHPPHPPPPPPPPPPSPAVLSAPGQPAEYFSSELVSSENCPPLLPGRSKVLKYIITIDTNFSNRNKFVINWRPLRCLKCYETQNGSARRLLQ